MVWLFVPASGASNWESGLQSLPTEPSLMWRGKPMPLLSLLREWRKGTWIRLLSGMTLEPSTADRGVEKWISSLRDSLASLGAPQENRKEPKMNGGYGRTLTESLARYDPPSSSWRTSQVSLEGGLVTFSGPWPNSGMMRNGISFRRKRLEPRISDGEFSSWPTPHTTEIPLWATPRASEKGNYQKNVLGQRSLTLTGQAKGRWPTPRASPNENRAARLYNHETRTLAEETIRWATPTTRDWKDGTNPSEEAPTNSLLGRQAPRCGVGGPISSKDGQNLRLRLNPQFVEWLMGLPPMWTDLGPLETPLFQQWQQRHSQNYTGD